MIVKILGSASSNFHGVQYNDKKVEKGTGELMLMKNFPSFINGESSPEQVRDYFKSISKNEKVKKPQFHAVISAKYQNHGKEEITEIAKDFMQEMGYGKQPFIVVYHSDTENNHVHIVSTRVDKQTGKKINDSYERLKAQKALADTLEKRYGVSSEEKLEKLLNYQIASLSQLELLLERSGFKLTKDTNDENDFSILKNGVKLKTIHGNQISFTPNSDNGRMRQLKAILSKYKDLCSNKVFKVEDKRAQESMLPEEKHSDHWKPKVEFESELQKKLRDIFGLDVVFHHKHGHKPFGYSIIDHKSGKVFKGSEIMKMDDLFEMTDEKIDKKLFESLKDYNLADSFSKQILMEHLKRQNPENAIIEFMLFESKKIKNREVFNAIKNEVKDYVETQNNKDVHLIKSEDGKYYAVHSKLHYVGSLENLIGENAYQKFLNPSKELTPESRDENLSKELDRTIDDLIFQFTKPSGGTGKDPAEEELRKRRKNKKRT